MIEFTMDDDRRGEETMATSLSAKEVAQELGTDARTVRKFLRKTYGNIGQGNRWNIQRKEIAQLKKQFQEWQKPIELKEKTTKAEIVDLTEEIDELVDVDDLEEI